MHAFDRRQLEQMRVSNDLREPRVLAFVNEQLSHPDPRVGAVAQQVLDGDLAVWQLVDGVLDSAQMEEGFEAMLGFLDALDPDDRQALREEVGADAASLRAMAQPETVQPSAEARFYLDQVGDWQGVSPEKIREEFGFDPSRILHVEGLEERLGEPIPDGTGAEGQ